MSASILSFPSKRERMLRTSERNGADTSAWSDKEVQVLLSIVEKQEAERLASAPRVTINYQRVQQLAERIERYWTRIPTLQGAGACPSRK